MFLVTAICRPLVTRILSVLDTIFDGYAETGDDSDGETQNYALTFMLIVPSKEELCTARSRTCLEK